MKKLPEEAKKSCKVEISKHGVRIKDNNKLSKYIRRNYGLDEKVAKALESVAGETTVEAVLSALENVKTRKERSAKKVLKASFDGIPSEDEVKVLDASNKARRYYKSVLKENGIVNTEEVMIEIIKERKKGTYKVKIVVSERPAEEEEEDLDGFF